MAAWRCLGIDVGARRLHGVALDPAGGIATEIFDAGDLAAVVAWAEGAEAVAVDAPDGWSTAPHAGDRSLSPKFRSARCGEIALGGDFGIWVPWTTPEDPLPGSWMARGVALFAALRKDGHRPVEVFPYAAFRLLNGNRPLPKKRSRQGAAVRRELLETAGVHMPGSTTHDLTDAAVAALVASHHARGRARPATCGHDGSAIWLPAPVTGVADRLPARS